MFLFFILSLFEPKMQRHFWARVESSHQLLWHQNKPEHVWKCVMLANTHYSTYVPTTLPTKKCLFTMYTNRMSPSSSLIGCVESGILWRYYYGAYHSTEYRMSAEAKFDTQKSLSFSPPFLLKVTFKCHWQHIVILHQVILCLEIEIDM